MSSRIFRRLQEEETSEKIGNSEDLSDDDHLEICSCNGARRKNFPDNPFDVLIKHTSSESDVQKDEVETLEESDKQSQDYMKDHYDPPRRKKKKKRKKCGKDPNLKQASSPEEESELDDSEDTNANQISVEETVTKGGRFSTLKEDNKTKTVCDIKMRNLNANNELRKMFGSKVIECDKKTRNRGRLQLKNLWLVNPKENWPPLDKTGISMRVERIDEICRFTYVHSDDYKDVQRKFLSAVNNFDQETITFIIHSHPYNVDALIQLSELYKLTEDLQKAADLIERALYCLESAFHPLFNMGRGICNLDYRCQQNRALFICLFKHLTFVGQRACYQTALELSKLLLSLDFELDPLAVILCIDFYALRSRNYAWLITIAEEWEKKKNLSQLPNFAFSTALAHYRLAEIQEPHNFTGADQLLQDALIAFPGILNLLLDKCSVRVDGTAYTHSFFNSYVESNPNRPLMQLITLYVHRTYHEWKSSDIIQWIERNVQSVVHRVESKDPLVQECLRRRQKNYRFTPRNVLRHIILSDIKEVTATLGRNIPSSILSFDPVPPLDSVDLYSYTEFEHYEHPHNITSLFFASLLPNFHVHNTRHVERNLIDVEEPEDPLQPELLQPGAERERTTIGQTVRESVRALLDAISSIMAGVPEGSEGDEEDVDQNEN